MHFYNHLPLFYYYLYLDDFAIIVQEFRSKKKTN